MATSIQWYLMHLNLRYKKNMELMGRVPSVYTVNIVGLSVVC